MEERVNHCSSFMMATVHKLLHVVVSAPLYWDLDLSQRGRKTLQGPGTFSFPTFSNASFFRCYGRPLLQAWLLPDLNTIPNICVREHSLQLSGFWCTRSLVRTLPRPYISAMHLFICFFVIDFVCKTTMLKLWIAH